MKVAVIKEDAPGERRVALVPETVDRLTKAGLEVIVEQGAGDGAWFPDSAYSEAGASIAKTDDVYATADVILTVTRPSETQVTRLRTGQAVIGMLAPLVNPQLARQLAARNVTAISLDGMPRTLSRTQAMDALSSQANIAGYKAVLVAAAEYGRFFPMLITAAATARPARLLVLGTGVAGLQAIGTARRLGAQVSGYDVRPASRGEVESLGATFIVLTAVDNGAGEGGYARELTADERQAQQAELTAHIVRHDVVITTAQVPGRRPPLLITEDAVKAMAAGSVIVDMGASALGGNVAGSAGGETVITENGVTIIGPENLPSTMATAASNAYSRNISALLLSIVSDGALAIDRSDEVQAGVVVTHDGQVVHPAVAKLLQPAAEVPVTRADGDADVDRPGHLPDHLRPRAARRHRGHRQGARHLAHAADVGGHLDPRDRPRGRAAHRGHRAHLRRVRAGVRGRVLRRRERRRRLRRDRPHAQDVPPQGPARGHGGAEAMNSFTTNVQLIYVLAAACFVMGLHLMNSPATARRGNQVSTAGMIIAVIATLILLIKDGSVTGVGWTVLIVGALLGSLAGLHSARTVQMSAMPKLVSMFNL